MFGGSEININFPKFIPVHLTYQTAFVMTPASCSCAKDVYGRDAKMLAILKSSERKVADLAVERAPNTSSKPVRMPVGCMAARAAATAMAAVAATSSTGCSAHRKGVPTRRARSRPIRAATATAATARARPAKSSQTEDAGASRRRLLFAAR
jgi:hypothetical protein